MRALPATLSKKNGVVDCADDGCEVRGIEDEFPLDEGFPEDVEFAEHVCERRYVLEGND